MEYPANKIDNTKIYQKKLDLLRKIEINQNFKQEYKADKDENKKLIHLFFNLFLLVEQVFLRLCMLHILWLIEPLCPGLNRSCSNFSLCIGIWLLEMFSWLTAWFAKFQILDLLVTFTLMMHTGKRAMAEVTILSNFYSTSPFVWGGGAFNLSQKSVFEGLVYRWIEMKYVCLFS